MPPVPSQPLASSSVKQKPIKPIDQSVISDLCQLIQIFRSNDVDGQAFRLLYQQAQYSSLGCKDQDLPLLILISAAKILSEKPLKDPLVQLLKSFLEEHS